MPDLDVGHIILIPIRRDVAQLPEQYNGNPYWRAKLSSAVSWASWES